MARYRFDDFTVDPTERHLWRRAEQIRLAPKVYDLLVVFVRNPGRLLTKEALLSAVWPDAFVEESIVSVHVSTLRRVLGDVKGRSRFIETVPRAGYRFVAPVATDGDGSAAPAASGGRPVELFELVGHGRAHFLSGSSQHLAAAESAFQAAIAIDGSYAPAYAGLALTRCAQAINRVLPHRDAYDDARAAALRALAMDSASADAQVALGTVMFMSEWDWDAADRCFRRALDINPDHSEALLQIGALTDVRECGAGLPFKQRALERAPHSALVLLELAISYRLQRRYDDAINWSKKALEVEPRNLRASEFLTVTSWFVGDLGAIVNEKRRRAHAFALPADEVSRMERWCEGLLAASRCSGRHGEQRYLLETFAADRSSRGNIQRAALHAAAGNLDDAFSELDRALDARDPILVYLGVSDVWEPLRADDRLHERLAAMRLRAPTHR